MRFEAGARATVNTFECRAERMGFRLVVASAEQRVNFFQGNGVGLGLGMRYGC
jgi:hypothetical protein